MSNHRLMIKPHGRHREEGRKKSSVLVTSMEDSEEQARKLYREQSRVVIEGFMQAPSHKQRVLEKLSSSQVKRISDTLLRAHRKKYQRDSPSEAQGLGTPTVSSDRQNTSLSLRCSLLGSGIIHSTVLTSGRNKLPYSTT
jgi:hypothetical protein